MMVVAILENPTSRTFNMVPFITRHKSLEGTTFLLHGPTTFPRELTDEEFGALLESGQARLVRKNVNIQTTLGGSFDDWTGVELKEPVAIGTDGNFQPLVLVWLGMEFESAAEGMFDIPMRAMKEEGVNNAHSEVIFSEVSLKVEKQAKMNRLMVGQEKPGVGLMTVMRGDGAFTMLQDWTIKAAAVVKTLLPAAMKGDAEAGATVNQLVAMMSCCPQSHPMTLSCRLMVTRQEKRGDELKNQMMAHQADLMNLWIRELDEAWHSIPSISVSEGNEENSSGETAVEENA